MKPTYRPEIDGLRALAVVSVIFFHAGFGVFGGGYVGVDVFFVISGYLITTILLNELQQNTFSLARFYERRARRILPALFLVMFACIPFAWLWMTPDQLRDFGRSLTAVTLFSSNFLFWIEGGYFQAAAETKPLLHTWSLAVEEQFYVVFPLLLMGLWRCGQRRIVQIITLLALLSLAVAQLGGNAIWLTDGDPYTAFEWNAIPNHAYFLMPARAWELLLGSVCAFYLIHRRLRASLAAEQALSIVGLLLIVLAVVQFDDATPFPGAAALLPTAGAALLILHANPGTAVAALLSLRPVVGIGLISYSAYLWHQPLFAFARLRTLGEVPALTYTILICTAFILAWLSWRFVEMPFREPRRWTRQHVLGAATFASLAMFSVGLAGHLTNGFHNRFDPKIALMQSAPGGDTTGCNNMRAIYNDGNVDICTLGDPHAAPRTAVLGDSHAASLSNALNQAGETLGLSFLPVNDNWCAPLYNFGTRESSRNARCDRLMHNAIDHVASNPDIETVILIAEWSNYTSGRRWGYTNAVAYSSSTHSPRNTDPTHNQVEFELALNETLKRLSHKRVVIVKSVPEYQTRVPDTVAKATLFGNGQLPADLVVTRAQYDERNKDVETVWSHVAAKNARFVETADYWCEENTCRYMTPEGLLYMDDNHLSNLGAKEFVSFLTAELPEVFTRQRIDMVFAPTP